MNQQSSFMKNAAYMKARKKKEKVIELMWIF